MPIEKKGKSLLALKKPAVKKAKGAKSPGMKKRKTLPKIAPSHQAYERIVPVYQPPRTNSCWAACAVMVADFLDISPLPTIDTVLQRTFGTVNHQIPQNSVEIKQMYRRGACGLPIDCRVTSGPLNQDILDIAMMYPMAVEMGVLWNQGGGHVVLIVGADESPQNGETFYFINDPDPNTRERTVTYNGLLSAFGQGRWYETISRFELA